MSSIKEEVKRLNDIQPWNHNFTLTGNIETNPGKQISHGKNLVKMKRLKPIFDTIGINGKNVLDMGCNEGFFSHYLASNGSKVHAIDIDEDRILKAKFVKQIIGEKLDINFENLDIYSKEFESLKRFDLCLCLGFIHRIPDPFTAIQRLVDKTDIIIFEWKALKSGPHDEAFAYFSPYPVNESDYYGTEYWRLSYAALEAILRRLGMKFFHRIDDPNQTRAILVAGKKSNPIFNSKDKIYSRGIVSIFLSHTKRYLLMLLKIFSSKINS